MYDQRGHRPPIPQILPRERHFAVELAAFPEGFGDARDGLRVNLAVDVAAFVRFVALGKLDADELGDAVLFHGDAIERVGAGDRALVMRDDDELALADEAVEDLDEA